MIVFCLSLISRNKGQGSSYTHYGNVTEKSKNTLETFVNEGKSHIEIRKKKFLWKNSRELIKNSYENLQDKYTKRFYLNWILQDHVEKALHSLWTISKTIELLW